MVFDLSIRTFLLPLRVLVALLSVHHGACSSFNRSSFPDEFVFGTASSAYQVQLHFYNNNA